MPNRDPRVAPRRHSSARPVPAQPGRLLIGGSWRGQKRDPQHTRARGKRRQFLLMLPFPGQNAAMAKDADIDAEVGRLHTRRERDGHTCGAWAARGGMGKAKGTQGGPFNPHLDNIP